MFTRSLVATAVAFACASSAAAQSADSRELERLRAEFQQQMQQMQSAYEARLNELEGRLRAAEGRVEATAATAVANDTGARDRLGEITSGSAFNPRISVILDGVYYRDNKKGGGPEKYEHIDGINHSHDHEGHDHAELERGFNLRETEIAFSATVSPYFDANLYLAVDSDGGVELEEAYFDTRALPAGLKLRGGKFLSGVGYLNSQHPHSWDFVDQNLAYLTLLGDHGLKDTGVQLSWLPKTGNLYTLLGVELLQGKEQVFATAGEETPTERADGLALAGTAAGELADRKAGPRLLTAFAKFGPDLGDNHALQIGVWGARANQHQEVHDHTSGVACGAPGGSCVNALQGKSWLWGTDWVYKFDAPGAYGQGDFTLAAEYLWERKDLRVAFNEAGVLGAKRTFTQDGAYLQAVYGIAPNWQLGARYDITGMTNMVRRQGTTNREYEASDRWTLALTRHLTEYSRLRLQASSAKLWEDGERDRVNQIFLQYQHSLGAHGAHKF